MLTRKVLSALTVLWMAAPAYGQFFVPDDCLTGAGFYDGDLVGDMEYVTAVSPGGDALDFTFYGEMALEWSDGDLDVFTVTDIEIDPDGFFAFVAEDDVTGNLLDVEGYFYDDCVVAGDYFLDIFAEPLLFEGAFEMEADIIIIDDPCVGDDCCDGDDCDDDDDDDFDFDADFCGFSGFLTMTATVMGMLGFYSRRARRSRLNRLT